MMKAIQVTKPGDASALEYTDTDIPTPKAHEALIAVKAIGVNFIDVYFREGRYPAERPFIPGNEAAGIVTAVGSAVTEVRPGDRVAFTGHLGSYAEFVAMPADRLVKVPDSIDFEQAAAAMLQGMTAHYLCHDTYPLRSGETALVHACAGGVGLLLVQMAKTIGARVIGTAGSEEKAQLSRDAGADDVIVYATHDFAAETKRLTDGRGVHVVYDGVGQTTFDRDLDVLRPRGYLVLFGGASGPVPPFDPMILARKGSLFLTRPTLANYIATREELVARATSVFDMIASGKLKLRIEHRYPLAEARQAHRHLEA
ncbi:MAG TPA: quinone oxidoreductase, partial [Thermoanaerobaculia bacterium]|nr:quinone oxidoreductase [Thermoanaerobaculia bacterium]